jgi:gliding motility-associated-like protein
LQTPGYKAFNCSYPFRYRLRNICFAIFSTGISIFSNAQTCPPNIDFESGTFNNWTCYTGGVAAINGQNVISLSPSGPNPGQHRMYSSNSGLLDPYGGFPVTCPNGSGYSVKLGNDMGGAGAEGIAYEFTIPNNRNEYSLIYHYAVVFQDPNHQIFEQPRLELEITNLTDNEVIMCSSFTFIPYGSLLPGFFISPVQVDTTKIWCKDWSAVSINLNGNAGKTIRLFFKTADCTFMRHFGYAYIDVNSECSGQFVGATYCAGDSFVEVTAPWGYQQYTWFNSSFTQVLGNNQVIQFRPPPPSGSTVAVEVVPYNGYGCLDTLFALLIDTLTISSNAGKDTVSCNRVPVPIGANPKPALLYQWTPATGLSDPNIANPRAGPTSTTSYILRTSSLGGGCVSYDTVVVRASIVDSSISMIGRESFCITSPDSAVLFVTPTNSIQWLRDNLPITGARQPRYRVTQTGEYYALLINADGCRATTDPKKVSIEIPRPGINYPVEYAVINYPQDLEARDFGIETSWSPGTYLDDPRSVTPVYRGTAEIEYTITIKSEAGCITVDTQLVKPFNEVSIYVPSAFTPNNDGLNDYLKPIPGGIKELKHFRIYNRWGQMVFDIRSDSRGWDGRIGGMQQTTQVYVWTAEGLGVDNRNYKAKGTVLLIR